MLPQKAKRKQRGGLSGRQRVVRTSLQIACFRCKGAGSLELDPPGSGALQCPKCLGSGKLPSYGAYEVDDG